MADEKQQDAVIGVSVATAAAEVTGPDGKQKGEKSE
jgi:hypothetical protein